jgi:hypothetical protein
MSFFDFLGDIPWFDPGQASDVAATIAPAATEAASSPIADAISLEPNAFDLAAMGGGQGVDIGSANPATFSDAPKATGTPQPAVGGAEASQAGVGPGVMPGQGQEAGMAPQAPPPTFGQGTEAGRQNWWQGLVRNAGNQVQANPWRAAGYGLMGAGLISSAINAGRSNQPVAPWQMPSYLGPSSASNTPSDKTLPPPAPGVSPITRPGMNVRPSQGLRP